VDDAGLAGATPERTTIEDIPEALRENNVQVTVSGPRPSRAWMPIVWGVVGLAIALLLGLIFNRQPTLTDDPLSAGFAPVIETVRRQAAYAGVPLPARSLGSDALLGHLPYQEADASSLRSVVADKSVMLRRAAAERFMEMVEAARRDRVYLRPISGFRTTDQQEYVFFSLKAEQGERTTQRAEVSAPPGYSEHHTGYAVDIGDRDQTDIDLDERFDKTDAFRWLQKNAGYYSFEMSFPRDNPQGIQYEPWHWRFVGDRDSLETFYKARSLSQTNQP
jgi:D-alanyl-D-alanine carboxypeptidase